jgi:hypothetical protein
VGNLYTITVLEMRVANFANGKKKIKSGKKIIMWRKEN